MVLADFLLVRGSDGALVLQSADQEVADDRHGLGRVSRQNLNDHERREEPQAIDVVEDLREFGLAGARLRGKVDQRLHPQLRVVLGELAARTNHLGVLLLGHLELHNLCVRPRANGAATHTLAGRVWIRYVNKQGGQPTAARAPNKYIPDERTRTARWHAHARNSACAHAFRAVALYHLLFAFFPAAIPWYFLSFAKRNSMPLSKL